MTAPALYTGTDPDTGTRFLVTVYDDDTRELAVREPGDRTWSAPVELRSAS